MSEAKNKVWICSLTVNTVKINNIVIVTTKMVVIFLENKRCCDAAKQVLVLLWGPSRGTQEPPPLARVNMKRSQVIRAEAEVR